MSANVSPPPQEKPDLTQSTATIRSDSENYSSSQNNLSSSPEPLSEERQPPLVLYSPPNIWSLLRGAAINLILPFVNGLMLGFGELLAHEAAFRLGWSNTKIFPHNRRDGARSLGPGIEVRDDPTERRWRRRGQEELEEMTALE